MAALPPALLLPLLLALRAPAVRDPPELEPPLGRGGGLLELEPRLGREDELVVSKASTDWKATIGKSTKTYTSLLISKGVKLGPGVLSDMMSHERLKGLQSVTFKRGTLEVSTSDLTTLQNLKDLKHLYIGPDIVLGLDGATALAKALSHCEDLSYLGIDGKNNIQVAGATALATNLKHLNELQRIRLGPENHIGDAGLKALLRLPKLTSMVLNFDGSDITIAKTTNKKHNEVDLKAQDLERLRDGARTSFAEFQFPSGKEPLVFPKEELPYDWRAICRMAEKQSGFDTLVIENQVKISGDWLKDLLGKLPHLTSVKLRGNNDLAKSSSAGTRTNDGLLALGKLKKLQELVIGDDNNLLGVGAAVLFGSLKKAKSMRVLEIGDNNVLSQVGAEAIAEIAQLTDLTIGKDNYLGPLGAEALAKIAGLERVEIGANNLVGYGGLQGVKALALKLKKLEKLKIYKAGNDVNATTVEGDTELQAVMKILELL